MVLRKLEIVLLFFTLICEAQESVITPMTMGATQLIIIDFNPAKLNGGFETGTLSSWVDGCQTTSTAIDTAAGYEGTYAARLHREGANLCKILQDVVVVGKHYNVYFRAKTLTSTVNLWSTVGSDDYFSHPITTDWTLYTRLNVECLTTTTFGLVVMTADRDVLIDNVKLEKVD